jgi:hypothetical protein
VSKDLKNGRSKSSSGVGAFRLVVIVGKTLRTKTLYQDKDWLTQKYVKEKLSTVQIAKIYRESENKWCDPNTISRWLKKHEIGMRSLAEAQQNRHNVPTPPAGRRGKAS